jgi:predicted transcriptional regulator
VLFYVLLSLCSAAFYFPITLPQTKTPTNTILLSLKKKPLSFNEIRSLFSSEELIGTRINTLEKAGLLLIKSNREIMMTKRGVFVGVVLKYITLLFGVSVGG